MSDIDRMIASSDRFCKDGAFFYGWSSTPFNCRSRYNGSPVLSLLGLGLKLYVAPVFDPLLQRLDGVIVDMGDYVTEGVLDLTPADLDAALDDYRSAALSDVKSTRDNAHNVPLASQPGRVPIYDINYSVALRYLAGDLAGSTRAGVTVEQYVQKMAPTMGLDAVSWCEFICSENETKAGAFGMTVEHHYCALTYAGDESAGIVPIGSIEVLDGDGAIDYQATRDAIDQAVESFRVVCGL